MPNILIIRLSSIGDIFHAFTVLPDIKKAYPDAKIDWLVDENFSTVAKLSPLIDTIITIPLREWKRNKFTWFIQLFKFKKKLVNRNYDYIIDTHGLIKSAFLAKFLFKGPIYGLDRGSAREKLASKFYQYRYEVNRNNVAVIRLRSLIAKIFNLDLDLSNFEFAINKGNYEIGSANGYIFYLHGTSRNNKKWPFANWIELSNWILNSTNRDIVLTYSNNIEYEFAHIFKARMNNERIKVIDKLDFPQLADLIDRSDLVIGVDTGFTHLANLLKKPTLAIYLHSRPIYVGMLESKIAHNFGGYRKKVKAQELIDYIVENRLL